MHPQHALHGGRIPTTWGPAALELERWSLDCNHRNPQCRCRRFGVAPRPAVRKLGTRLRDFAATSGTATWNSAGQKRDAPSPASLFRSATSRVFGLVSRGRVQRTTSASAAAATLNTEPTHSSFYPQSLTKPSYLIPPASCPLSRSRSCTHAPQHALQHALQQALRCFARSWQCSCDHTTPDPLLPHESPWTPRLVEVGPAFLSKSLPRQHRCHRCPQHGTRARTRRDPRRSRSCSLPWSSCPRLQACPMPLLRVDKADQNPRLHQRAPPPSTTAAVTPT